MRRIGKRASYRRRKTTITSAAAPELTTRVPECGRLSKPQWRSRTRRSCDGGTGHPGRHECESCAAVTRETVASNGGGCGAPPRSASASKANLIADRAYSEGDGEDPPRDAGPRGRGRARGCGCGGAGHAWRRGLSADAGGEPRIDGVVDAARNGRRSDADIDERQRAALAEGRWVLGRHRRPVDGLARRPRRLGEPARGRSHDARRHLRDRERDVRRRAESGRQLSVPPRTLRRLVGRGRALAVLQPVPPHALRLADAVSHGRRRPLEVADRVPAFRVHPLQRESGGARARVGDLPPRVDRPPDPRLRQPSGGATRDDASLAPTAGPAADRNRDAGDAAPVLSAARGAQLLLVDDDGVEDAHPGALVQARRVWIVGVDAQRDAALAPAPELGECGSEERLAEAAATMARQHAEAPDPPPVAVLLPRAAVHADDLPRVHRDPYEARVEAVALEHARLELVERASVEIRPGGERFLERAVHGVSLVRLPVEADLDAVRCRNVRLCVELGKHPKLVSVRLVSPARVQVRRTLVADERRVLEVDADAVRLGAELRFRPLLC